MEIKAADVMKLRKMTGAGMMDCKKALQEAEGDYARAQDIIREKGKLIVAKRADRSATEGVVVTKIVGQKAYLLCQACETDFVAQNAEYAASANAMLEVAVKNDAVDRDALLVPAEVNWKRPRRFLNIFNRAKRDFSEVSAYLLNFFRISACWPQVIFPSGHLPETKHVGP